MTLSPTKGPAHFLILSYWGLGFQHMNFEGGANIQFIAASLPTLGIANLCNLVTLVCLWYYFVILICF